MLRILFVLLVTSGWSQTLPICNADHSNSPCVILPSTPTPKLVPKVDTDAHSFLDRTNLTIFFTSASAISTETAMSCSQPQTTDPVVRKNCNQLAIGGLAFLSVQALGAGILHKTHHHTLERTVTPAALSFHVFRMIWISTHRK